ncbi:thioredoxin-like protein [Hygrophoropsis aurantiaca]|uniref:Thioredoxin-like protein n=1 Tax=Hygrophoropsis aurantiaca TaxID=72124 RepID=A0ACB8AK21_9AGAM|nr:thioredoxin-like protein [Hygrophoropsis aurantiaca]
MAPHTLVGKPAPSFSIPNYDGETYNLTPGVEGKPIALFFYPESGSYGCTREACQFRDALAEKEVFKRSGIQVIGVSPDPVDKQKQFVERQKLTFPVLSDEKREAHKAYQIGRGILGLTDARTTFFIDSRGVVRDALDATMNFSAHVKFVLKWLDKVEEEEKKQKDDSETPAESPSVSTKALGAAAQAVAA